VEWISQTYPYRGYDIASFKEKSVPIYLEVKASSGTLSSFHFTENEFNVTRQLKTAYSVICVSHVLAQEPNYGEINDPIAKIQSGALKVTRDGLIVSV
jgi:hypothetical protein